MENYKLNLFVRVIRKRIELEQKTSNEILSEYTKLTDDEKEEIKNNL